MAKKTIGYVELEWTCPNCTTENPGLQKTCKSCGSPQPENVQFHAPKQQAVLTDAQKVAQAQKGADFHCPYCNTRNPADATTCSQCGGDLTGAAKRISGQVVGAAATPAEGSAVPVVKPPQPAKTTPKFLWLILSVAAFLIMTCCVAAGFLVLRTEAVTGTVQSVSWQRTVPVEELHDVILSGWEDQVPAGVKTLSCEQKQRSTDQRVVGSHEVCTQRTIDEGNGVGRVEEDCHTENEYESYPVYDNYCTYPGQRWEEVTALGSQGDEPNPYWPTLDLKTNQREGERKSVYTVMFKTEKGIKEYTTKDEDEFRQCQIGSTWTLNINSLDVVMSIQP